MDSDGEIRVAAKRRTIRRIRMACTNCRKKKAKCSGERPVCSFCKRLSQECRWGRETTQEAATSSTKDEPKDPGTDVLLARIAALEAEVDSLTTTLNACSLPTSINQPGNEPLSSFPSISSLPYNEKLRHGDDPAMVSSEADVDFRSFRNLPPPYIASSLVDVYFTRVQNQPYCFFHERSFRQRLANDALPDHLKFAVLAAAIRFSDDPYYAGAKLEATAAYAAESWKRLVSFWCAAERDPDIYICQTVTILATIDYTAGKHHPAWLKVGMAIRVAQDLGLMTEPDSALSFADQEERRRVFWSIYILDKLCSCCRARPSTIGDAHCLVQLPSDEATFRNGTWKRMPILDQLLASQGSVTDHPGNMTLLVLTVSILGRCTEQCIHERNIRTRLPPWDPESDFSTICAALLQLETQYGVGRDISKSLKESDTQNGAIDMQVAGQLVFYNAIFHTCQCILYHPFLLYQQIQRSGLRAPPVFLNRALQTSREHACANSQLLREAKAANCDIFYSFLGYCATVSGSIHALFLQDTDDGIMQQARYCLQAVITYLEEISRYWNCGKHMRGIVLKVTEGSPSSSSFFTGVPNTEDLGAGLLENMWASVDYISMIHGLKSLTSPSNCGPRPSDSNSVLNPGMPDEFDAYRYIFTPTMRYSQQISNLEAIDEEGMSLLMSYFSSRRMNFGA